MNVIARRLPNFITIAKSGNKNYANSNSLTSLVRFLSTAAQKPVPLKEE